MWQHIYSEIRIAKKDYSCTACEWLSNLDDFSDFSFGDKRTVVELLRKRRGTIRKGDIHIYSKSKYEGEIVTSRYLEQAHELCKKYDVYRFD